MKMKKYEPAKKCRTCKKLLRERNKSGLCAVHYREEYFEKYNQRPEVKERKRKYYQEKWNNK